MKTHFFEALKTSLIGGVLSGAISGILNYYVFPFPENITDNVMGHAFGGFFCGTITAIIGIMIILKKYGIHNRKLNN
jgi:hypothetical protein